MAFRSSQGANNTLKSGYSTEYSQGEVTIVAQFDYNGMRARKAQSGVRVDGNSLVYPNVQDINLGIEENEIAIFWNVPSNQTRSGGQKLVVFTALNGLDMSSYRNNPDLAMRKMGFAGIAKTQYRLDGTPSTSRSGPSDATESGIAICASGVRSANRHTGQLPIPAGGLVCVHMSAMPGTGPNSGRLSASGAVWVSPNNPGHGQPIGKFVMVTAPFNPSDFSYQLQTVHALFRVPKNASPTPGVLDMNIEELYRFDAPGVSASRTNTDPQEESGRTWYSLFGIFFAMLEQLSLEIRRVDANNAPVHPAAINAVDVLEAAVGEAAVHTAMVKLMTTIGVNPGGNRSVAENMMNAVMLNNCVPQSKLRVVVDSFKVRNPAAFPDGETFAAFENISGMSDEKRYAGMCWDAVGNLFAAYASAAYEKSRWVIGRARNSALSGDTLDLNLCNNGRPLSK